LRELSQIVCVRIIKNVSLATRPILRWALNIRELSFWLMNRPHVHVKIYLCMSIQAGLYKTNESQILNYKLT
jgi:hypothetical protein